MKRNLLKMSMIALLSIALMGCKDKAKEANTSAAEPAAVATAETTKYVVNVTESKIEWKGSKPTGTHFGTVNLENGVFSTEKGKLQSGTFLINMNSIEALDTEGKMKNNLEAHLKGTVEGKEGDFFNVKAFPTAAFEITGTEEAAGGKTMLSGNLTLKGQKHNVTFPVTVKNEGDMLTITSEPFTIDRTKWGVNYGSKSIFDNLGDKFINDNIELKITLKAKKS